ncbi:hypothetical protein GCM10010967_32310 [Dyadobacter beijingensis]|uniref:Uncharacterized protein n=1 Tax=Dyadobacter beijingensis TaxID=365489 RepID=A0ABQ2I1Y9_9BACT|nr:hypothetical protein [Dyadobacter beijingensis]GGM96271.1 hypothetical protein GCM10010967_32310 [Dyadobacter beijingensis]
MKTEPDFLRWFGRGALIVVLLTFAQAAWLLDHGKALKKDDITANGIGDLELATSKDIFKILDKWSTSTTNELQPFFLRIIRGEPEATRKTHLSEIAKTDIYWDFLFIVFYSAAVFVFLNKAIRFWRLAHLKMIVRVFFDGEHNYLSVLSGRKVDIALWWAAAIGILDVLENLLMLYAIQVFDSGRTIVLPIIFAAPKFVLLALAVIFVLVTFLFFTIILLINSPKTAWEKFVRLLGVVNDPY